MGRQAAALVLLVAAAAAPAQEPGFHDLWLQEMLAADPAAAAEGYRRLATDRKAEPAARLLAAARLLELHYGGGATLPPLLLRRLRQQQPRSLQPGLRRLEATAGLRQELLAQSARGDAALSAWLATVPAGRLEVHGLLPVLLESLQASDSGRPRLPASERRRLGHLRAFLILERELQGRTDEARRLRRLWFPQPEPTLSPADLDRALRRLAAAASGPADLPGEAERLAALERELRRLQAEDPSAALALLARLPFYREQLTTDSGPDRRDR